MQHLSNALILGSVFASSIFFPAFARSTPQNLTCNATLSSNNGSRLSYTITGRLPTNLNEQANLSISVRQRALRGTLSTLLDRAPLKAVEQIAPDADYSRLPFNGTFRGRSNDGRGIYSLPGSQYGLYVSLRPLSERPQQVQIVHYLTATQYVRSGTGSCTVS